MTLAWALAAVATAACDRKGAASVAPEGTPGVSGTGTPPAEEADVGAGVGAQPGSAEGLPTMLARVRAGVDLSVAQFDNERRATWLKAQPTAVDPQRRAYDTFVRAVELQRAGRLDEAVTTLQSLRAVMTELGSQMTPASDLYQVTSQLAVSWLRIGEVENCALSHTIDSCLLPIQGEGVHQLERGSRGAQRELERLLRADPTDLRSRWLLNIAAMTLGEYPDKVPAEWLLDPSLFVSDEDIGRFVDVAHSVGLARVGHAGGGAMDDFDGDGDLDVVTSSVGFDDPMAVYLNSGDGTFADVTARAGLDGLTGGLNLISGDYDNDGDVDVFVLRGGWMKEQGLFPNSLLANRGDATFEDVTVAAGLLSYHPTQTGAWGDYDNDGFLDLYVGNETLDPTYPHPNELFHNNGDGTFTNVASLAGVDLLGYSKAVAWGDYDNDADLDLYISRYDQPNLLLRNDGPGASGVHRFEDVAAIAGVEEPTRSFPAWFWDYDNDGWLDIFVSGYDLDDTAGSGAVAADYLGLATGVDRPRLYRNATDGTFEDVTERADLWHVVLTMGSNHGDLDNDGWEDLYLGTGDPDFRTIVPNLAYRGTGAGTFADVTTSGGFGHLQKGHAVSFGDIDNDGDQDIHQVVGGSYAGDWYQNVLFENPGHGNHWITLRLEGEQSNRSAFGARIRVDVTGPSGTRSIHRTVGTGGSFGANSLQQEIGLGDATTIDRVAITWPTSGVEQVFEGVAPDQVYRVREGAARTDPVAVTRIDLAEPMVGGMPMNIPTAAHQR